MNQTSSDNTLVVFQDKKVRRIWHNDEWYFVVIDLVRALTDSINPADYLKKVRKRDEILNKGWGQIVTPLEISTSGGPQTMNFVNTEGAFRLIQSIPSPKAEPFKQWLAKVGYERIQEIENPELAQDRAKEYYELKGYPKDWIDKRIRGIAIRQELTGEWKNRGIEEKRDYAILTNEIAKATFGVDIQNHKRIKGLNPEHKNQNLRDHMNDLELIFSMLGEKVTTEITKTEDAKGFAECEGAAKRGGKVAGNARVETEREIGKRVVSSENYLGIENKKEKKKLTDSNI